MELNDQSCRWPHGDPRGPGFFFCGSPEANFNGGVPYCRIHQAIAYAPYPRGGA
jgi:GcrA cell cycle regulator